MSVETFTTIFREEHRAVRDTLFDLLDALGQRDRDRVRKFLKQLARFTGPHFRYDEEVLYPHLVEIFGENYIEELLGAHDWAIGAAHRLIALAHPDGLTSAEAEEEARLVRGILPHVSDRDGISIMVERLPEGKVQSVLEARAPSNAAGLHLASWATEVRQRPARSFSEA